MQLDPRILAVLKDCGVNYRSAQWSTDIKPKVAVLRVDALAYAADKTNPAAAIFLEIDRLVSDTAYAVLLDGKATEVLFTRAELKRYPSLVGGDNYLYFVAKH